HVAGRPGAGVLYDAVASDRFCGELLKLIDASHERASQAGRIVSRQTAAYHVYRTEPDRAGPGPIRRGSAEQRPSNLVFGAQLLLKLFRRLDAGVSADFEVGRFLTERTPFAHVPKTLGALEQNWPRSEPGTLALLQTFVANQGQGWEYILGVLGRYYEQVSSEEHRLERIPSAPDSLLALCDREPPPDVFEVVGAALRSAAVLGSRTGQMHLALASDPADPDFAPEPLTRTELVEFVANLKDHARRVLGALRARVPSLAPRHRAMAEQVIDSESRLVHRIGALPTEASDLIKIRVHGDYH